MNCPTEELLLDYTAGRLDRAQAASFERHADSCVHCGELRAAQAAVWRSLDEWKPAPVSEGFNRELWRRIDAEAAKQSDWSRGLAAALLFGFWKRVAPLAVAVALVVTGYMLDQSGKPSVQPGHSGKSPIVMTAGDADQLDMALDDLQLLREVDVAAKPASGLM
jgi:anti-sigma factor RsiW